MSIKSYYEEKLMIFSWKFRKYEQKGVLGLGFSKKKTSSKRKNFGELQNKVPIFQILHASSNIVCSPNNFINLNL